MVENNNLEVKNNALWTTQSKQWRRVGFPQRPSPNDVDLISKLIMPFLEQPTIKHVVVYGVTPEIINLPLPLHVNLHAFDNSLDMIKRVWLPPIGIHSSVTEADWRVLPLSNDYADVIVGDGILTAIGVAKLIDIVLAEATRILKPQGTLVLRCFIRPDYKESLTEIEADVLARKIKNFGTLKWRIAHALVNESLSSSRPIEIYEEFERIFPDRIKLSKITGWTLNEIATIDTYRDMPGYLYFPTYLQLKDTFNRYFECLQVTQADYELSERCPIFQLKKLSAR